MKKHFLLFAAVSFFGISHAFAQNPSTKKGEATVFTDTHGSSDNSPHGTITRAGKNQQSVYTPAPDASNNAPVSATPASQQALPAKTTPAVVDPKK